MSGAKLPSLSLLANRPHPAQLDTKVWEWLSEDEQEKIVQHLFDFDGFDHLDAAARMSCVSRGARSMLNERCDTMKKLKELVSSFRHRRLRIEYDRRQKRGEIKQFNGVSTIRNGLTIDEVHTFCGTVLSPTSTISELSCQRVYLPDEYMLEILNAIEMMKNPLNTLSLYDNRVTALGASYIAHALKSKLRLERLDIESSSIGDEGAEYLSGALKENSTLTELSLICCNVGNTGAKALADALQTNTTLMVLDLQGNRIKDEGAIDLAGALISNRELGNLILSENEISDEGASSLAQALGTNETVEYLNLDGNNIGNAGAMAFEEHLRQNTTLTNFYLLSNNPIDVLNLPLIERGRYLSSS